MSTILTVIVININLTARFFKKLKVVWSHLLKWVTTENFSFFLPKITFKLIVVDSRHFEFKKKRFSTMFV